MPALVRCGYRRGNQSGDVMAHAIPTAGFSNHGFFRYNMKLFWRLAKANSYDCLDAWMSVNPDIEPLNGDVIDYLRDGHGGFRNIMSSEDHPLQFFGDPTSSYRSTESGLYVFLRKNDRSEFQVALDLADEPAAPTAEGNSAPDQMLRARLMPTDGLLHRIARRVKRHRVFRGL
jgi:hypothetical protein